MKWKTLILASSQFLFLHACTPTIAGLQTTKDFNYGLLTRENMIMGGVFDKSTTIETSSVTEYATIMQNEIADERKDYKLKPIGEFITALGQNSVDNIWKTFRNTGHLTPEMLKEIANKLPNKRFIAFAKIDNDTTSEKESRIEASETKDKDGKVTKTKGKTIYESKREVTIFMNVFDLNNQTSAFSGSLTQSETNSKEVEDHKPNTVDNIISIVNAVKGNDTSIKGPQHPTTQKVAAKIFEGFAENMPKK